MKLQDALAQERIHSLVVPLNDGDQHLRLLYATTDFVAWLRRRLETNETSPLAAPLTPAEQLDELFYTFISGRRLIYSRQFRYIRAEKNAVWELKTPDLRIFGWFPIRDCFICAFGDWADHVKDHDLYRGYRLETRRVRRDLAIDEDHGDDTCQPGDILSHALTGC